MITIIDYGIGNLGSIYNMLKKNGSEAIITSSIEEISKAKKLILPGVGSFDYGMLKLRESGLIDLLNQKVVIGKTPILGICLGMQLFTNRSEEGNSKGLGWIDAQTVKFNMQGDNSKLKIPHMGWNRITIKKQSVLLNDMYEDARFYFVHSYYVQCNQQEDILTTTEYGFEFHSGLEKGNIAGVQFHPEKSHKFGLRFLKNFVESF